MVFLGKSNAFEISQKLGLNNSIIEKAKSLMTSTQIDIENLLKSIYDDKSLIEKEKLEISKELERVKLLRTQLEKENEDAKRQEQDAINNAKIKARDILLDAKEDANKMLKQMQTMSNRKDLENARNAINSKIKGLNVSNSNSSSLENSSKVLELKDIVPNKEVFVATLGQNGIILSHVSKSNEVQVQVGLLKMNVNIKDLQESTTSSPNSSKPKNLGTSSISKTRTVQSEVNVIGLNVEEAIFVVDKFLDDACLGKLQTVRIVHGKGTGKLKNGIHQFLKKHPHAKEFRLGTFGEGEAGVTIVTLK